MSLFLWQVINTRLNYRSSLVPTTHLSPYRSRYGVWQRTLVLGDNLLKKLPRTMNLKNSNYDFCLRLNTNQVMKCPKRFYSKTNMPNVFLDPVVPKSDHVPLLYIQCLLKLCKTDVKMNQFGVFTNKNLVLLLFPFFFWGLFCSIRSFMNWPLTLSQTAPSALYLTYSHSLSCPLNILSSFPP